MLINFRFQNCRSFLKDSILSLEATVDKELNELNTFKVDEKLLKKGDNELLKSAIIFGPNASGKSNVIKILSYMRNVVLHSASQIAITTNCEPFAFLEEAQDEETLFEVEIISNGTYYKYGFTILHGLINQEWLYKRENRREIEVFKRTQNSISIKNDKKASEFINISPTSLFLSLGKNFHLKVLSDLKDVNSWFINLIIVFEKNDNTFDIYEIENGKYKKQALEILKLADIGIKDLNVLKEKIQLPPGEEILPNQAFILPNNIGQLKKVDQNLLCIDMETKFDVYNKEGNVTKNKNICLFKDRGFNSEGTTRLLCYLGWMLYALDKGRVLLIDEIDSKLHFLVVDYILQLFNSIHNNPNNAQLVATAHDVMLMDENLRRDQIYFTSKNSRGESSLVCLSDFKNVRKQDLFSKKYLAGFYIDLPDMQN